MTTPLLKLIAMSLLVLGLSACDKKDAPTSTPPTDTPTAELDAPSTPKTEQADTPTPEEPKAAPKAKPTFKKLSKDEIAKITADKKSASQWLNDGRKAVQAKKYDEGIELYTKAMKIHPNDPTLLAELGWAHYLKGNLDMGRAFSNQAMLIEKDNKKLGALLYNLGRIAEDEKKLADASVYYQRSLALRPNDIVQKRLAGIDTSNLLIEANVEQLCAAAMSLWECTTKDKLPADNESLGECTCEVTKKLAASSGKGPFKGAAILSIKGSAGAIGGSIDGAEHLAVETANGGWQLVSLLTNNYSPGVSYIHNNGVLESIAFQTIGDQEVLVVRYSNTENDGDYGDNSLASSTDQRMLLCAKKDQGAQCIELGTGGETSTSKMLDDMEGGPETPSSRKWTATATLTPEGKLKYDLPSGQSLAPEYASKLNGERSIDELATIAAASYLDVKPLR